MMKCSLILAAPVLLAACQTSGGRSATLEVPVSDHLEVDAPKAQRFEEIGPYRRAVTTSSADAQWYFDQGLAWTYSFNHDEAIRSFARAAELDEWVATLPDGYDTVVGERGQKLSGGQRQRVSIARAVMKDPAILILDEATSAVDNETEAAIQRSMERIAHDRTTIVIAHRLSTIRGADRILVLDHGQVVEHGRHEQLVANGGLYAQLWGVQTGEHAAPREH